MLATIHPSQRPPAPHQWDRSEERIRLALHHILPYSLLRNLWNQLVNHTVDTQLPEAATALRQLLRLCDRDLADVDEWIRRIRHANVTDEEEAARAGHRRGERTRLQVHEVNMLATVATWPPWNIVEGPANEIRADDPGDEGLDLFTHGITRAEFSRMQVIERLYHDLLALPLGNLAPEHLSLLAEILRVARREIWLTESPTLTHPIPFRREMWEQREDTLWQKRTTGEQFIPGP